MLVSIFTLPLLAQIPRTLSYQGILTDSAGTPRPDGAYTMTFRLYQSSSGGSAIWTESKSLQLKGGLFSTSLGDATPFPGSMHFNAQYWLSVQVGTGTELAPRTAMTATPYSLSSEKADSARIAGGVGANAVTTSGIADNAVTSAKIQNGSIQFSDIGQNGAANGQVMKWNGSSWAAGNDSVGVAGSTGPWQLNGSTAHYTGGNVGIGTSFSTHRLSVQDSNNGLRVQTDNPGGALASFGGFGTFMIDAPGTAGGRFSLLENGNVGVGTSTPSFKLDVNGTINATEISRNGVPFSSSQWTTNGVNLFYNSGNIGIGTTTPSFRLDVNGSINAADILKNGVPLSTSQWTTSGANIHYSSGNVGIGTITPGFPLSFGSTSGDKISLWGQSGPHYGFGIQGGQLQIHTDVIGSDILFGYGTSGSFTERMRIKGNGNVGIGTSTPNAPLAFPPALGKKITLYPGATGDVGFGVSGNRLQIYSDNPNADVAIGYDAAGTFNERFAVKPNGALAVSGNTGTAKQVLTTGGSGAPAQWQPLSGILQTYFSNQSQVTPLLTSTTTSFVFNNHSYTINASSNSRLVINGTFSFRSVSCLACSYTEDRIRVLVNGGVVGDFNYVATANGMYSGFTISNFMYDLTPGTYTVTFEVIHYSFSGTNAYAWLQSSSLMVLPL